MVRRESSRSRCTVAGSVFRFPEISTTGLGNAEHAHHERDVLKDGEARNEAEILENESDAAAVLWTCRG